MKRIRAGYHWPLDGNIGTTSYFDGEGLVLVPYLRDSGQYLFRFFIE